MNSVLSKTHHVKPFYKNISSSHLFLNSITTPRYNRTSSSRHHQMNDHESLFTRDEQEATVEDSKLFVRYMASPELFDLLDMESIAPHEGKGANVRMHTTRLITDYMNEMANKALGVTLYEPSKVSTLLRQQQEAPIKKENEMEEGDDVHVFGEQYKGHHQYRDMVKADLMKHLSPSIPITEQDMVREIITIRHDTKPLHMKIRIENYVYVTYLSNTNDHRKRCKINLLDMASKTLMFGIQHSKNKFSKNDLRYRQGSHLIFESGVLVETGSTNPLLAAKLLEHTMNIFRYVCGYYNIGIWERRCHNVVATGSLNFGLCLELLKHRYPYVTYERKNFAGFSGAIICINDIDTWGNTNGATVPRSSDQRTTIFDDLEDYINYEKNCVDFADEYNRKYNNIGSEAEQRERDLIQCNLTIPASASLQYEVLYDEFDISHVLRGNKEKNVKALVFPRGRVICVGNKSREGVIEAYSKLFPILESVRDSPENIKEEKRINAMRRQNYSRKKKPKEENEHETPNPKKRKQKEKKENENDDEQPKKKKRKKTSDKKEKDAGEEGKRTGVTIQCRYCDMTEPYSNYKVNMAITSSEKATLCDTCNNAVCHECVERLDCPSADLYQGFVCPDCSQIK